MNLINILSTAGLDQNQAAVYLALLKLGEASPTELAKEARLKRPTVYTILEQLAKKGCTTTVRKGNRRSFRAVNPQTLVENVKHSFQTLEGAIPRLLSLNKNLPGIPQIKLFLGSHRLVDLLEDTLNARQELLGWLLMAPRDDTIYKEYLPRYIERRIAKKIYIRAIVPYDKTTLKLKLNGSDQLRDFCLVPKTDFPLKTEMSIYNDKVAMISWADSVGLLVRSKALADSMRLIFEFSFAHAKLLESKLLSETRMSSG